MGVISKLWVSASEWPLTCWRGLGRAPSFLPDLASGLQHSRNDRPPGACRFGIGNSPHVRRGGQIICTYFDENFLNMVPAAHVEGLYSCLDYYQGVSDPFSRKLLGEYDQRFPGAARFTGVARAPACIEA
jgi:hypothetical protein